MSQHGLQDIWRGKGKITTHSCDDQKRADDLVNRNFSAQRPNQLWVADFTYIKTLSGWVYTASLHTTKKSSPPDFHRFRG